MNICMYEEYKDALKHLNLNMLNPLLNPTNQNAKRRAKKVVRIATICLIVLFLLTVIVVFVVIPIVFMLSFTVQENLMFTRFGLPRDEKYYDLDLPGLKNFYIDVTDIYSTKPIRLGVWHLLPWDVVEYYGNDTQNLDFNQFLANNTYDIVLHFHGTGETRRDVYKMAILLRTLFQVISFDYRGYGDSSDGEMTEVAVVEDCKQVYRWLRARTRAKIYVWGRSLGASLALRSVAELSKENIVPRAVVVESAFTTMREELPVHPFGQIFSWLPWLDATILNPLEANGFYFDNSKHIVQVPCPVMTFHAEDDSVIPLRLGRKLSEIAMNRNKSLGAVVYHQIPVEYGCDHFALYLYPDLLRDVINFVEIIPNRRLKKNRD